MHRELDTLIEQAEACRDGDCAAGLALAEQVSALADSFACSSAQCRACFLRGFFLLRLDRPTEAAACLGQGLKMSRQGGDQAGEADCLYWLGMERRGAEEHLSSLDYFLPAQTLYEALGDQEHQANALNAIGAAYFSMEDHVQAIRFYLQAFRLREAREDKKGMACSLNNIAGVYTLLEDFEQASIYYNRCLDTCRLYAITGLEILCLSNLSEIYTNSGRIPEAVEAAQACLGLSRKRGDADLLRRSLLSMGGALLHTKQYDEALSCMTEAVALSSTDGCRRTDCEAQTLLGEALLCVDQTAEAHEAFTRAETGAAALSLQRVRSQALSGLSKTCEQQGDPVSALAYYKECYALDKMFWTEAAEKRSKTLMMQMEVEKVQKEAHIHQLKNAELAVLNTVLAEANQTLQAQAQKLQAQREELKTQAVEMHRQATEDGLTGLANRRQLELWLAERFQAARQSGSPLTVAMADVDHFKQINDRFGHQTGDEVLMSIGELLRHACRASDLAARYGGEEFVLVLPETDVFAARTVCERFRQTVEKHPWQTIHPGLSVTISLGLSAGLLETAAVSSYERLLGQADAQLYSAKNAGRNRVSPAASAVTLYH